MTDKTHTVEEIAAMLAEESALWVRAIETYFDGPTVENVEAYVERFRAEAAALKGETT